ncbi:MAG TPA: NAD(P)H-binding protein, partial [Phycisphaerales bacterium]|nr:NAD(P)H-binding protein [Phycisphaerales bacterium]
MSTINTVAVTGGTGFVGRRIVAELLRRGYGVRVLARDADEAADRLPASKSLKIIPGDILDRDAPARLVEGSQAVVHLIGIIREKRQPGRRPQTFQGMHVDATRAILQATGDAGVRRYVHMSALGVAPDSKAEYARTKYEAEQIVRRSGLDWTIFRPALIHGADGEFIAMVRKLATGDTPPFFFIPFFARFTDHAHENVWAPRLTLDPAEVAPVLVDDVATVFCEALSRPQTIGEVYNVAGSETLNWRQLMEHLRDHLPQTDHGLPALPVPSTHAAAIAKGAGALGLGGLLPFDEGQAHMGATDTTADLHKLRAHFGIEPVPFRAAVDTYAHAVPVSH